MIHIRILMSADGVNIPAHALLSFLADRFYKNLYEHPNNRERMQVTFTGTNPGGRVSRLEVVTGNKTFKIFQDIDGIEFGQKWKKRLTKVISTSRFLIPIVTPLFFESDPCRNELKLVIGVFRQTMGGPPDSRAGYTLLEAVRGRVRYGIPHRCIKQRDSCGESQRRFLREE